MGVWSVSSLETGLTLVEIVGRVGGGDLESYARVSLLNTQIVA